MNNKEFGKAFDLIAANSDLLATFLNPDLNPRLKVNSSLARFSQDGKTVVRVTCPKNFALSGSSQSLVVTFGRPNYEERNAIKRFAKVGLGSLNERVVKVKRKSKKSKK